MLIAELAPWRRENHKLRDTNELPKTASDFAHRNQAQNLRYDPNRGCGRNTPRFRPHPFLLLNPPLSINPENQRPQAQSLGSWGMVRQSTLTLTRPSISLSV